MAMTSGDSDDEYGWDLSPEEEQKLISLVANLPPSTSALTTAPYSKLPTYSLEPDIETAFGGTQSLTAESTRALCDKKDHRDVADVNYGFVYGHVDSSVSRLPDGTTKTVADDTPNFKVTVLDENIPHYQQASTEDISYSDGTFPGLVERRNLTDGSV